MKKKKLGTKLQQDQNKVVAERRLKNKLARAMRRKQRMRAGV